MHHKLPLPDFIIAGAPRSGTTWLYHLLRTHPDVFMAQPIQPEPKFFLVDETYAKGIEYYSNNWFSDSFNHLMSGEKSTNYMESPVAARRIYEHLPQIKLIFVLREPADRALSNYFWSKQNGLEQEDFARALELEEERELNIPANQKYSRPHDYFARGLYAKHLERYFALFSREQILCLRFEDIVTNPRGLAIKLQNFLQITPRPHDADKLGKINPSKYQAEAHLSQTLVSLKERYLNPNKRLAKLLGPEFTIWD